EPRRAARDARAPERPPRPPVERLGADRRPAPRRLRGQQVAIEALADAYRYELKATGVDVSIVQPGSFPTSLVRKSELGADVERGIGYGRMAKGLNRMAERMEGLFSLPNPPDPEEVAAAIAALVEAPSGERPARVVVDRFGGDDTRALNDAHPHGQARPIAPSGLP